MDFPNTNQARPRHQGEIYHEWARENKKIVYPLMRTPDSFCLFRLVEIAY